jgi:hypothetical protein
MIQTIRDHGEVEQLAKETKNKQKLRWKWGKCRRWKPSEESTWRVRVTCV